VKNIAIIEDHPTTRKGLEATVASHPDLVVSLSVASVEEFLSKRDSQADVVILDLGLHGGGLQGTEAVDKLTSLGLSVLVFSMRDEAAPVVDAISAGAMGYLTKVEEPQEIVRAILRVASAETHFSATVAGYLRRDQSALTKREREVLKLVADGETARSIARILHIAETTVNNHLDNIRNKTGSRNRAALTRLAIVQGIVEPSKSGRPKPAKARNLKGARQ
jgi:DNA-binding NarL/FixJ family response regulator